MLDFAREIEKVVDKGEVAISIFMDLSKAFDTVDKNILYEKLHELGIVRMSGDLLYDYMTNRTFSLSNDDDQGNSYEMNYGVPQGSILGPLLFLLYIYDMKNIAPQIKSIVYADDTTLIVTGRSYTEAVQKSNAILQRYFDYYTLNKLTLNSDKTKYMVYANKKKRFCDSVDNIYINDRKIDRVRSIKFLGVTINDKLTWEDHKIYIKKKIARNLGIMYKCRRIMDNKELVSMYNCFVLPYLLYCLPLWGGSVVSKNDLIVKIQNKVMRVICRTKGTDEAWGIVKESVMPITKLYKYEIAKFCYKHSENMLPEHFSVSVMPNFITDIHSMRTKQSKYRNYHTKITDFLLLTAKSFHRNCIKIWNEIPHLLRQQKNLHNFNKKITNYILATV